ncbi:hypothetical protein MJO28_004708 [Puccinia striiformis f. sp. tritici]|uniref:Uncharacterized protein n=4 Tax=Puccinia striiformis TaxID=27350 RepID=A0A0L0VMI7_9BASI|nr:hypothetical protein Pst134EA_008948 [Puccinia striiformis f. sp. tritici]KAI9609648.1 hypothetical protein H4Q26_007614 [Puccinia striiformis f. sp. tritici PST-130]KNF00479.1 hypothetical protein PSTG_06170 [Puccinia striiformis f. sp. tritici PST-78]POW02550.1 hypothetical protein PSHT_12054 [Puccinia striiformis]KAH9457617.1 hypothetical protein Pst134EB_009932 [Puccinia striiformis f. sp. tritici]KAH9457634.1 hypothetical protein Pst134EB_009949 [Puccinia striiformis f. sp. tritici]
MRFKLFIQTVKTLRPLGPGCVSEIPPADKSSTKPYLNFTMYTLCLTVFALLSSLTLSAYARSIDTPTVEHCYFYTGANTTSATCSGKSEFKCSGGCHAGFVQAEGCQPNVSNGPDSPQPTTQICDVEFSLVTPSVTSCVTSDGGRFSCGGATSGFTTCYDCLKPLNAYRPGARLSMKAMRPHSW